MSSTKNKRGESPKTFFEEHLEPISNVTGAGADRFFPRGPERGVESYYVRREQTAMSREEFELLSYSDAVSLAARLRDMWSGPEDSDLAALAGELAALAERMASAEEDQPAEVSPFIYVMF